MDIIKSAQRQPLYLKYWYVIAGVLALTAAVVFISRYRNVSFIAAEDSLLIETVRQGPMTVSVRGYGKLTAKDVYWIVAKAEGQVEKVSVKAGDRLRHGDVLVQLSNTRLMQQLRDAEPEYEVAWTEQTERHRKTEQENFSGVISTTTKLPQHQAGFAVSARKINPVPF